MLAALALSIISSLLNVGIMLSLALAMSFAAFASLVVVGIANEKNIRIDISPKRNRLFKHDRLSINSIMRMATPHWVVARFSSFQTPFGVEMHTNVVEDSVQIWIEPVYAGRHKGIEIRTEVSDALDLFKKEIKLSYSDFLIDSLPISLLDKIPKTKPSSLGMGETSSRFSGASVELHSLDDYRPFGDTKNILWKKVARIPDERLIVRVRESNIPRAVRIGLLRRAARIQSEDRISFMDQVCEAIGFLGNSLIAMGCSIEIVQAHGKGQDGGASLGASNVDELASVLMEMWDEGSESPSEEELVQVMLESDILVTGFAEMQEKGFAQQVSKRLLLLIRERAPSPIFASQRTAVYSDNEDLRRLVVEVV